MTETEWNECDNNIEKMLNFVTNKRKKRLFACALARQTWHTIKDELAKKAIIIAEQYADMVVGSYILEKTKQELYFIPWDSRLEMPAFWCVNKNIDYYVINRIMHLVKNESFNTCIKPEYLLKDIFDPFFKFLTSKITNYTKEFAKNIYNNPTENGILDNNDLSILADMLYDEGYDESLVNHLRTGIHVKGCEALDLVIYR